MVPAMWFDLHLCDVHLSLLARRFQMQDKEPYEKLWKRLEYVFNHRDRNALIQTVARGSKENWFVKDAKGEVFIVQNIAVLTEHLRSTKR